ncbi:unnamed protein product [Arctia plantaginis]|uniref:ATP-dependent DNA helicase n=1 Tax=Arctia plantaginis TaxID=874455 RepID=A0A8S0ZRU7_ARCPL|nr:unnamed protein product [Arctia plantaginis]CAB3239098.1 unnamed protein product [Arctia plantaginis]
MDKICNLCQAIKWAAEAPGICCSGGKVNIPKIPAPTSVFKELISGSHPSSKHFLNHSRQYNTLFQMTSFGAKEIREGNFMPTFKVQGQVYHLIGNLLPAEGAQPEFLQIYFVSHADQVSLRSNLNPTLQIYLIDALQTYLNDHNMYIQSFKYNLENRPTNDFKLIIHADVKPPNEHRGRYNAPIVDEVAVLLIDEDKGPRDIVLNARDGRLQRVSEIHRSYDPLQYPLLFPFGNDGYCINIPQQNTAARSKTVSCMQFYAFRFMVRINDFNSIHYFKGLFNQYCVDMAAKMISERLDFIKRNQKKLRAEEYIHLRDAVVNDGNIDGSNIGQHVILPSSFTGSPRYMNEKSQDAMTYVRKFGRPDLFITFTCNSEWPEIKIELLPDQNSYDRHDLVSRVFHLKLKKMIDLLTKKNIFGPSKAFVYSVEWQKRGLPHAHILLWLANKVQPDSIDAIISAEIPDQQQDPILHNIVIKNMIHGPCGFHNPASPCMKENICSKKYPRHFISETQTGDDGYPTYRRRSLDNGGKTATIRVKGTEMSVDNRWVVPYNPVLSRSFNAHINVEFCQSVKAIKYICKYIHKGSDQATFSLQNNNNEVEKYLNGRYISSSEALWRFFQFPIHERLPAVVHLAIHLENGQRVYFYNNENLQDRVNNPSPTTLTAFFDLCKRDNFAKTLLYHEVPQYYVWGRNSFSRRRRGQDVDGYPGVKKDTTLGRVYNIHPTQTECYYLRMILQHVRGPMSFEHLRTVNGVIFQSYQGACKELGLLEGDEHWQNTMSDAVMSEPATKLRELFTIILIFCQPSDPLELWNKFRNDLCEDILNRMRNENQDMTLAYSDDIYNDGLIIIEDKIHEICDKSLTDFGLPASKRNNSHNNLDPLEVALRKPYDVNELNEYITENEPKLVNTQVTAYNRVMHSVLFNEGKIFFLDASGGTGKTFITNLILAKVRSQGKLALAVASSGIAATLLAGGRTAHSTFKLPLTVSLQKDSVCSIRKNGPLGKVLQDVTLIIWDECTMIHRAHVEALDRTLRDIRSCDKIMGGITVMFAGDFRQTLPVIVRGTRADIVKSCLKSSPLWKFVHTLKLSTNMRAHLGGGSTNFPSKLLLIGDGKVPHFENKIEIDRDLGERVTSIEDLISKVYPDIVEIENKDYPWMCQRAILAARNSSVDEINELILTKLPGDKVTYTSIDNVMDQEDAVHYPQEFLNSLNPSGLPPHSLKLKIGAPIILLRNLKPPNLCNGTRLQVKFLRNNVIVAIVLTGPAVGQTVLIPRIPMIPNDLPFNFKRIQFPVKLSFAVTINKSQGQTFKHVGIDLRQDCFSHGQLYVALSRSGCGENQYVLLPQENKTKNVIYAEVL